MLVTRFFKLPTSQNAALDGYKRVCEDAGHSMFFLPDDDDMPSGDETALRRKSPLIHMQLMSLS